MPGNGNDAEMSPWRIIAARVDAARWLLAAALLVIVVGGRMAGVAWLPIAAGSALVLLAAAFAPRSGWREKRSSPDNQTAGLPDFAALSAARMAEAVPDPLLVLDAQGVLVHANAAARNAFNNLRTGTALALRFRAPEMQKLIEQLIAGGPGAHAVEYHERVPIERWFRVVGRGLGNGSNLFALVFKDQSEVRRIDRMRSDFIANASHELRTPLASVAGFIETIRGPARNDRKAQDHFLGIMQDQTARMARLIDDLLSLSRLEMKPYLAPGEVVDIVAIVGGVIDALTHLAAECGLVIERDLPASPVMVHGSRDELIQVFENLLENACKYGQSGDRVIVRVEAPVPGDPEVRVTVRDFGPGIPAEHIPRITERFYRIDVETSRAQKGTGLGLAIVKHILTRHNARLTIKSDVGEGAAFTTHFPAP